MRYRQILKDSFHLTCASGVNIGLNLVRITLLARVLGAVEFGLFVLAYNTAALIGAFVLPRFEDAVGRFLAESRSAGHEGARQIVTSSIIAVVPVSVGLILISGAGARLITDLFFHEPKLWLPLMLCLPMVFINPLRRMVENNLKVLQRFKPISIVQVVQPCMNLLIICIVLALGGRLKAVVVVHVVTAAVMLVAMVWILRDMFAWRCYSVPRPVWRFWLPVCLSGFANTLHRRLPFLLVGHFFTAEWVAFMEVAERSGMAVTTLVRQFRDVGYSAFLNTFYQSREEFKALFNRVFREYSALLFLMVGVAVLAAPSALPFFFGAQYAEAVYLFQLLAIAMSLGGYYFVMKTVVYLHDKSSYELYYTLTIMLLKAAVVWIACRAGSLIGVGYALITVQLMSLAIIYGMVIYLERFVIQPQFFLYHISLAGGLLLLVAGMAAGVLQLPVAGLLFAIVFIATSIHFKVIPASYLAALQGYLTRIKPEKRSVALDPE